MIGFLVLQIISLFFAFGLIISSSIGVASTSTSTTTDPSTMSSAELVEGNWYLFSINGYMSLSANKPSASKFCKEKGAKLYEPRVRNVAAKIKDIAKRKLKNSLYYWIGVHDISRENHFVYNSDQSAGKIIVYCF